MLPRLRPHARTHARALLRTHARALLRTYSTKPPTRSPGPGLGGSFGGGGGSGDGAADLNVGEMADAKFRIEPLRRHGEDLDTTRARLLYQSRKRGILETDLLLSTFADAHLHGMDAALLEQYDRFLDENDWDIYYWTTQTAPAASAEGEGEGEAKKVLGTADGVDLAGGEKEKEKKAAAFGEGPVGEWAQTVGRVKEPYRPPPKRWSGSTVLGMLREHVAARRSGEGGQSRGKGLGRMPDVRVF